jgi:DNA-binding transcriptional MerR regulator
MKKVFLVSFRVLSQEGTKKKSRGRHMLNIDRDTKGYRIKSVSQITGLTTHAIRKWENRYNLCSPQRSENGYRVYSQGDLQLLMYLKSQTDSGIPIGQLAALGDNALQKAISAVSPDVSEISEECREGARTVINAARAMDQLQVETILHQSLRKFGLDNACGKFFFPLLKVVGRMWHEGKLAIAGEHLISQTIRRFLSENALSQGRKTKGPTAIVGCMPNDFHDIGAMTATGILQQNGWKTIYLGPDSDIELIHFSCVKRQSSLVVLGCVFEQKPEQMKDIIFDITKFLLPITSVVVGGLGATLYRDWLEKKNIQIVDQVQNLKDITPKSLGFRHPFPYFSSGN